MIQEVDTDVKFPLIPEPVSIESKEGAPWIIPAKPIIAYDQDALADHASALSELWWRKTGQRPRTIRGLKGDFVLSIDAGKTKSEAYRLEVAEYAHISAGSVEGVARGTATLMQLARPTSHGWTVPRVVIEDEPACDFRAVMIDVARQPHDITLLEDLVDLLFFYKIRYLHLHLTDDQSFRFEFPPVTDALSNNVAIPADDWSGLMKYAAARGIAIIPELDLPGHSTQLKRSGYLEDPTPENGWTDADVAHPQNYERIFALVDAMRRVFTTSPYFHIGGDESGAGKALIPFLAATNQHLRRADSKLPPLRMIVWEGFHGAPGELPATGDDRIIVAVWESHYNPPWKLLDAGYQLINASWKPLYVVGSGSPRYPHIGGREWDAEVIHSWNKNEFWHWQPGTPVFEDRGPFDTNKNDGIWPVPEEQRSQVIGGQLLFWEQRAHTVLADAWDRVPALADRLWCGDRANDAVGFQRRLDAVGAMAERMIRPVEIAIQDDVDLSHPTASDFHWFDRPLKVALTIPSGPRGDIRWTLDGSKPIATSSLYTEPITISQSSLLQAGLFIDSEHIGALSRARFDNRPARALVRWYDLPRRPLSYVPDFSDRSKWTPTRVDLLPEIRGAYKTTEPIGQWIEATYFVAEDRAGEYSFRLQTRDGRARLYVDGQELLGPTDPSEVKLKTTIHLAPGPHKFELMHAGGAISPVLLLAVQAPGDERFSEISPLLTEVPRTVEPGTLPALKEGIDLLQGDLSQWIFLSKDRDIERDDVASLRNGVLRIEGRPHGSLQTKRWFRDYQLELEWRWPEGSRGNSGVLVHTSTPLLFYGWPRSLEVQLMSGRAGEFWVIGDDVEITVEDAARRRTPKRPGNLHSHRRIPALLSGPERKPGAWNHMRIHAAGDEIVVHINGVEINRGIDCTIREGAIALQSEGSPIEFRNVRLKPLPKLVR